MLIFDMASGETEWCDEDKRTEVIDKQAMQAPSEQEMVMPRLAPREQEQVEVQAESSVFAWTDVDALMAAKYHA